ncbi:protein-L-isoaspartate(D-aspartate) O-methyltransferase [Roseospirillum parvum]|uniref:Protein-L-isoaspartate O-methyltransferase n=1 Tax=Roseospirillum parvum TaxID=83401 RepID=A0A1G7YI04_9PROT|nr:protein-L-isoaspartate(D-aspartate) O-methyltransferase [Roseospirillum parvum]SDG95926.1 protein-L-isoaspartate(D-aspartate) O-methyltransferase [Roseospirillum parvum]
MTYAARKIRLIMELRTQGITDTRVLAAVERLPREAFVAEPFLDQAYENRALPIDCGQTISQPLVVGFMTQALDVGPRMKVLEIGTGSGYQAAILARLCRRVYTIERHRDLLTRAERRFADLGLTNITAIVGDGHKGWPEQAPFDRILVTAAARQVPQGLVDQLAEGGVMVVPVEAAGGGHQEVVRLTRRDGAVHRESLMDVRFVPLVAGLPG